MNHQGRLVTDYMRAWPTLPSLTLAKKIYREHPEKFTSAEAIRTEIRMFRGKSGTGKRNQIRFREFFNQQYEIPETFAPDYEPYILPNSADNILVLSDIHIPFHDPEPIEQAVRWAKERDVNAVLLNGDTIDCYQLSRFIKDSRYPTIRQELNATKQFLDYLHSELPGAVIYWKNGNHEERLENFLRIKAPELLDVLDYQLDTLLQFGAKGINYITDKRIIYAGKLPILHGHEFFGRASSSVNPARALFLKAKQSALMGHFHRESDHTGKRLNDEIITCWSTGCMCGLHLEYARINEWVHSFARVKVSPDKTYKVASIRIIDGKIY